MSERSGPPTESATPSQAPPTDSPPTDSPPSGRMLLGLFFLGFVGLLLFFALYVIVSFYYINPPATLPTDESTSGGVALRGQFGDMFGVVTAFFTGLGFIGVGLTVV